MARNRVIYQSEAVYVSSGVFATGSTQHAQLERVQSANYNFSLSRQDINQYGHLARLDSIVIEQPTVGFDLSYYLTDGFNERALGFYVQTGAAAAGQFASGHMIDSSGQNFYITNFAEGFDATGNSATGSAIGIGNAYVADYSLELAVGSIPTVSLKMEASNLTSTRSTGVTSGVMYGYSGAGVNVSGDPIVALVALKTATSGNSAISALRPGDVTVDISSLGGELLTSFDATSSAHIQSASLSVPLSRGSIQRLGSRFAFARPVNFPLTATLNIKAIVSEMAANRALSDLMDSSSEYNATLNIKKPGTSTVAMAYTIKGCRIESENFSSSIGSNKSVDVTITTQVGGIADTTHGVFVSGANASGTWV